MGRSAVERGEGEGQRGAARGSEAGPSRGRSRVYVVSRPSQLVLDHLDHKDRLHKLSSQPGDPADRAPPSSASSARVGTTPRDPP